MSVARFIASLLSSTLLELCRLFPDSVVEAAIEAARNSQPVELVCSAEQRGRKWPESLVTVFRQMGFVLGF